MDDGKRTGKQVSTKLLIKSSFWYTISNFLTRAIVFLTTPIFARILTNEQYGDFTVFASWQAILIIICGLEIYGTINRARFDFISEESFNDYISSCLTLSTFVTTLFFLFYVAAPDVVYKVLLLDKKYVLIMFAYLYTYPAVAMFQAKQRIEYKYKFNAAISFVLIVFSSVLAVALAYFMVDDRLFGRVIGQYMLYAVAGAIFYAYFIRKGHKVNKEAYKYALRIGLPLVFSFLGGQLLLSSDNIIVKHMCSASEVSYISMTHTCAHIILLFVQTLNTAWAPWFYDKLNVKEYKVIDKTFSIYMYIVLGITIILLLFSPELIAILGGARYHEALYILPGYIMCGVFTALTSQFVNLETFYKKPEYAAILTGIAALINIGLDIIGVWFWGYRIVCYVTVLCQIILVLMHYKVTIRMDIKKMYSMKNLMIVLIASLVSIPAALLLYQNNLIRWIVIGLSLIIAAAVLIKNRDKVKTAIIRFRKEKE